MKKNGRRGRNPQTGEDITIYPRKTLTFKPSPMLKGLIRKKDGVKMKTVYSAPNVSLVSIFQNILEVHGIRCWLKNQYLSAGVGEIPPIECWPQLCVDDADFPEAKRIVEEALSVKVLAAWKCGSCGEEIEGQFTDCWKCGSSRPPTD